MRTGTDAKVSVIIRVPMNIIRVILDSTILPLQIDKKISLILQKSHSQAMPKWRSVASTDFSINTEKHRQKSVLKLKNQ